MDEGEAAGGDARGELGRLDEREVRGELGDGGDAAAAYVATGFAGDLQDNGKRAGGGDEGEGVLKAERGSRVLKDECGVDEIDWCDGGAIHGEIGVVEFQSSEICEAGADGQQVVGVEIDADDALRAGWIDAFKAVAASDAEHGDGCGAAQGEDFREECAEGIGLIDGAGGHVGFVISERDVEPGVDHLRTFQAGSGSEEN